MTNSNAAAPGAHRVDGTDSNHSSLIDVHSHMMPDFYVEAVKAQGAGDHPEGMPAWPTWDIDCHLQMMDQEGIAVSMLSVPNKVHYGDDAAARRLCRQINEFGAQLMTAHPDRIGLFVSLPVPDIDGALNELAYAYDELGADGVLLNTNMNGLYLGDKRLRPLLAELDHRNAVVSVHPITPPHAESICCGRPSPMIEYLFDTARTFADLLFTDSVIDFPNIRWIVSHAGGVLPLLSDRMQWFRTLIMKPETPTVPLAEQLATLYYDLAGTPFPTQVPALIHLTGTEQHLLYGSDYCWTPPAGVHSQLSTIDQAAPPRGAADWRALTTTNAHRIFPRLASAQT
ncbi:amidohydrolase [Mycobacteroides abscessus subsp. massiliense]|uniref:amidohydrolase family protein n=1 Tax=Mycobacteroides abscessus TaxID=36809 RepID=UPI0009CDC6D1|nr:amidohydrolase family protein [Mycobacteroides abscessus]SKU45193.1 amidohydrolase [Mycobacteroides abscessus subsp. massiliense]